MRTRAILFLLLGLSFAAGAQQTINGGNIKAGTVADVQLATAIKPTVGLVATSNLTLSGAQTIDGVAGSAGVTLVLATAQTTASQNGPWVMQTGAWTRPVWYPTGGSTQAFQFISTEVRLGTIYQGSMWKLITGGAVVIDTTATTWVVTPRALNNFTTSALPCALVPAFTGDVTNAAGSCATTAAGSLVKSVALTTSGVLYATPVNFTTSAGTATGALTLNTQSANFGLFGPATGAAATPAFRAMVNADLPTAISVTNLDGILGANTPAALTATTGTFTGALAANSGSLTTNQTTGNLFNTTATTINLGGAATAVNIGGGSGTVTDQLGGNGAILVKRATQPASDSGTALYLLVGGYTTSGSTDGIAGGASMRFYADSSTNANSGGALRFDAFGSSTGTDSNTITFNTRAGAGAAQTRVKILGAGRVLMGPAALPTDDTVSALQVNGAILTTGNVLANGGSLTTTQTTGNLFNATVTNGNLFGAGTTISIGAATGTTTVNNGLVIAAGTTTKGPFKFTSGTNLTTAAAGTVEYDGTSLFFTRTGTTRESILTSAGGASAPSTTATPTFTSYYGSGGTIGLSAPTTWLAVVINGTTYKIPGY